MNFLLQRWKFSYILSSFHLGIKYVAHFQISDLSCFSGKELVNTIRLRATTRLSKTRQPDARALMSITSNFAMKTEPRGYTT